MQPVLHPYQSTNLQDVRNALQTHKHVIDCAATGSGKSVVFVAMAQASLTKGRTVLIMSESLPIFDQILARVPDAIVIADGCSHDLLIQPGKLHLAMAQTLQRREAIIKQLQSLKSKLLIIDDEVHVGTSTNVLKQIREAYLVGFTATPYYKAARHLPELYEGIVIGAQPRWLVDNGYLSPYKHFARQSADLKKLKRGKFGEFTDKSNEEVFGNAKVYEGLKEDLLSGKYRYKKAIIFVASIAHCDKLQAELSAAGIPIVAVHSKLTKEQQRKNLHAFKYGSINVCVSVGQLTKGFDFPALDLVILDLATNSLPKYFQMIGRGSRTDGDNKSSFTVLDYGANYSRFGLWDDPVDWKNLWNKLPKKSRPGTSVIKLCPKCEYIVKASVKLCPNCGFEYPEVIATKIKNSIMVEVTEQWSKLKGRKVSSLSPSELAVFAQIKNKKQYATRVARSHHVAGSQGYLDAFADAMGYSEGWIKWQLKDIEEKKLSTIEFYDQILF